MLILLLTYQKSICVKQVRLEIARNVIYDRSENTEKKQRQMDSQKKMRVLIPISMVV